MLQLLKTNENLKTHEAHFVADCFAADCFVERYERLLGWALHLTDHDRAQAEDLLHDAFIQFTLAAPDLDEIRNLDNYLFGVLRVLRVSQLRRNARQRLQQLSIIEYDSAELGLRMLEPNAGPEERFKIQDELRAVCRYACARKESSKAGSVLILRFFHGYYPSEIAAVLRVSRKVVDMRLQSARREARDRRYRGPRQLTGRSRGGGADCGGAARGEEAGSDTGPAPSPSASRSRASIERTSRATTALAPMRTTSSTAWK